MGNSIQDNRLEKRTTPYVVVKRIDIERTATSRYRHTCIEIDIPEDMDPEKVDKAWVDNRVNEMLNRGEIDAEDGDEDWSYYDWRSEEETDEDSIEFEVIIPVIPKFIDPDQLSLLDSMGE